jgi:hypothetical protein
MDMKKKYKHGPFKSLEEKLKQTCSRRYIQDTFTTVLGLTREMK